jgi:uncharacterized protein YbjQ (UPF0145 family)
MEPAMKLLSLSISALLISLCGASASARDDIADYSIADALASEKAKNILGTNIQFYFGDQPHGAIVKRFSESATNHKTNGSNKTDKEACEWAFLSAMKALRDKAQSFGANAVVNIRSNYRNNISSSATTFKCGSGMLISGVALVGDVVEIK